MFNQKTYDEKLKAWQEKAVASRKAGKPAPGGRPRPPRNQLTGQHRPANYTMESSIQSSAMV